MTPDGDYLGVPRLAVVRHLQRAGQWDGGLDLIDGLAGQRAAALRADILVDRHVWRLDPADEAVAAIAGLSTEQAPLAALLRAVLEYWRRLVKLGGRPVSGGEPAAAFAAVAAEHPPLRGWATFWHAVATENLRADPDAAAGGYARAHEIALAEGDRLLVSYAVRHQGFHLQRADPDGAILLLRRSLALRTACGARPQAIAAQAALARALGAGPEADDLRDIVAATAVELGLTWLRPDYATT